MSQLHTLLLTDIVDSTAIAERIGDDATARLWTAHDRVARDLLRNWHGREIDKTDGLLILFDSVANAVGFAQDYHRALAFLDIPLKARVGMHSAPLALRENDPSDVLLGAKPLEVDGIAKPITARLMSIAQGGQTLLSAVAASALGPMPGRLHSHGHWRAKGLAEPFEIFEVTAVPGAPALPPPSSTPKAYRVARQGDHWLPVDRVARNLPAERDAFVGRGHALHEVARRISGGSRLLSIVGIGGCGKTRLATHFAWSWLGDFPGGAWFCDLSAARNLDGIVRAVAASLDVPLSGADPVVQLGHAIAARGKCLLLLDNFEQVSRHADETLGHWLDRAPEAQFVITTREILGLIGEEVFVLPPLPQPDAAALFVRRAQSASRDFPPTADDDAAIGPLVKLLDGLPLAIELAAARVRVMQPAVLLQRMSERFKLLSSTGGRRDRQATLRATFDWSWDLLPEAERAALAQLSVFEGGFTLEAAEAVIDLSGFSDAPWPADAVHSLVDKSFVRPVVDGRFDLLASMQEYASEHLGTQGHFAGSGPAALHAAQARHWAYFAALDEDRATADKGAEVANLVAACRRAVSAGAPQVAVGLVEAAWAALRLRGPFRVGHELAVLALSMSGLDSKQRGRVEIVAARALRASGLQASARPHLEAALSLAREAGDRHCEARALSNLGAMQGKAAGGDESLRHFTAALDLARELQDAALQCEIHNGLGNLYNLRAELDDALLQYESGLAVARRGAHRRWEAALRGNVGNVRAGLGKMNEAREDYEAALLAARDVGDRMYEGNMLSNLGYLHLTQGRPEEGRRHFEPALVIARELGHTSLECTVRCNLALACDALGRRDEAHLHFESALAIARSLQDKQSEGQILGYLGMLLASEGIVDQARQCFEQGEQLLLDVADRFSLGVLMCKRAEAEHHAGQGTAALAAYEHARTIAAEVGAGPGSELGLDLTRVAAMLDRRWPA